MLELESQIQSEVQKGVDKSQREYFLREQLKAIQKELGEGESGSKRGRRAAREDRGRRHAGGGRRPGAQASWSGCSRCPPASPEVGVIRTYLEWLVALPWATATEDSLDLTGAAAVLDEDHYGLDKVKERILEYMAVRKLVGRQAAQPRSSASSARPASARPAWALDRPRARAASSCASRSAACATRPRSAATGAPTSARMPGRIIQAHARRRDAATRCSCWTRSTRSARTSAATRRRRCSKCSTRSRTTHFSDHYLEVPFDLSQVHLHRHRQPCSTRSRRPLRDRMEVIELPGYTEEEKLADRPRFLVPRQLEAARPDRASSCAFTDDAPAPHDPRVHPRGRRAQPGARDRPRLPQGRPAAWPSLRTAHAPPQCRCAIGADATLRRASSACRASTSAWPRSRTRSASPPALAWSPVGGDLLAVEVTLHAEGKGDLILTGQLGEVMQESAQRGAHLRRARARRRSASTPELLRPARHPHPRPGRRDPEGRPLGRHHHGHRADLRR